MGVTYGCELWSQKKKKKIPAATYHCVIAHHELICYFLPLKVNTPAEMEPSFIAKHNNCGLHYLQHESLESASSQNFILLQN